jgi:apolipoprotein N-acyltransferase
MDTARRAWWWAGLGFGLLILSQTRWGVAQVAWLAPAPLLAALRLRRDRRFRWAFVGLSFLAWTLATLKIVTPPVPALIALGYGIPLALAHLPAYFLWDALARRGRATLAVLSFAAASALLEWAQAELTPFGVWGALPTTQVGQLAILQLLALVGMPGLSFLMHAVPATLEATLQGTLPRRTAYALAGALVCACAWGSVRAVSPIAGPEVRVALLRTDSTVSGLPMPEAARRRADHQRLLERTEQAARAGARLVVWPEAANVILPSEEPRYMAEASAVARAHQLELVVSYIAPVATAPLQYENRARWFAPDGSQRIAYLKHHPVPAEPAIAGPAPAPSVDTPLGRVSLAICYDYDFPALARAHARAGTDLVALPSSDWRGIDPIHTEMAAMRAIEGGFSLLRATRFGLSGAIDAHGRLRAQQSSNESREGFVLAALPAARTPTLYTALGNLVLLPLLAIVALALHALIGAKLRASKPASSLALSGPPQASAGQRAAQGAAASSS